jgi:hypothetical protein
MTSRSYTRGCAAVLLSALALALSACDPAVGPPASSQAPIQGMTLTVETYGLDLNGARLPGTNGLSWITTAPDTATFGGVAKVSRLVIRTDTSRRTPGDTMFLHFADNGDVAVYLDPTDIGPLKTKGRWLPFPIGLKGSKSMLAFDTSFTRGGTSYRFREGWLTRFLGSETLDTGVAGSRGAGLATLKAQLVQTLEKAEGTTILTPVVTTHTIWYAPKLGMIVRYDMVETRPTQNGGIQGGGVGYLPVSFTQR